MDLFGRLCYVASREGHLLDILSFVHKDNLTPTPALLFNVSLSSHIPSRQLIILTYSTQAIIANLMIMRGDIESLIDFFSFTVWIFYGMAMAALIMLRWKRSEIARPYKVRVQMLT